MIAFPVIALGLMSGTSLDGLDLALVKFQSENSFELLACDTLGFSDVWLERLQSAPQLSGLDLSLLDRDFGSWLAEAAVSFLQQHGATPAFIASHGYTVHHLPQKGLTVQIGNPAVLAAKSGFPVIADFRQGDVALGGQGAPLVPAAEPILFPNYQAWLNLGGIANLTYYNENREIQAADLVPCNQILNILAGMAGKTFDQDGQIARKGQPIPALLNELSALSHYQEKNAKQSLGREWVEAEEWPVYQKYSSHPIENLMATAVLHIAGCIAEGLQQSGPTRDKRVLVTGGGAHHTLLMALIGQISGWQVEKPGKKMIDSKEAIVFAWLGLQRMLEKPNTITRVTGASRAISSGGHYLS